MSQEPQKQNTPEPAATDPMAQLVQAIIAGIHGSQPPRRLTFDEYENDPKRNKHFNKPEFSRPTFQNGYLMQREQCSADLITLCNELKPGLYCDGDIEVASMQHGGGMGAIDIRYQNKSVDQRFNFKAKFGSLEGALAMCIAERRKFDASQRN